MSITTGGLHVRSDQGSTVWFNGDVLTVKLTGADTNGSVGLIKASVPPGGGPVAHVHPHADETFYVIDGELEFLNGDRLFTAGPGDTVFIPRGTRHRFKNVSLTHASMVFFYTPGGGEGLFVDGGDQPQPGVAVLPWGPERIDERLLSLLDKYGTEVQPEP
ncbi:cupin domain-containing protein [Promicromonospora iranensis]|uniref:Quercetin dioxygenase-like cupin family protein n=1 Tax=Promicromonospora iranensis TaxID=1105144 RepID=A0ABU2CME4_9MICO|nr:cupin domain-containing protein [Promicromonospora iranensis]MDR7382352.1 quercetin dioxygenase-like cupin family protein [Promicromonospora iranensis]